jgi:hypothetical protein
MEQKMTMCGGAVSDRDSRALASDSCRLSILPASVCDFDCLGEVETVKDRLRDALFALLCGFCVAQGSEMMKDTAMFTVLALLLWKCR